MTKSTDPCKNYENQIVSSIKIYDFVEHYPTFGVNKNIYTDFLSNWGSIILLVHLMTAFAYIAHRGYWLERWFLVTVELAVTTSLTVTSSYWILLGGDDKNPYRFMNVHEHVMNTVLALTSFLFVTRAFTWWHVIFLWIYGVWYGVQYYLSYLWSPIRNNIYELVNWEDFNQEHISIIIGSRDSRTRANR